MCRRLKKNSFVIEQFSVFDLDGFTKKSGLNNFTANVWCDGILIPSFINVAEIGTSGEYYFYFIFNITGYLKIEIAENTFHDVNAWNYEIVDYSDNDTAVDIKRILGLSHENIFIDKTIFDANSQLLSARVRLFDSKENCDLATVDGNETAGLLSEYTTETSWLAVNKFAYFKQVKN